MFFQKILKGISGLTLGQAAEILTVTGIESNWIRTKGSASQQQIAERLTREELQWHLTRYEEIDMRTGESFGKASPFISTTGGTSEQSSIAEEEKAYVFSAFDMAGWFATVDYTQPGWVFYGYVFTIGKPSVEYVEFAEEVRDLHSYPSGYSFHHEGELVAKLVIPPSRLERCEFYRGPELRRALEAGERPTLKDEDIVWNRSNYVDPMNYINIRDVL
jgi:hypothetical protein